MYMYLHAHTNAHTHTHTYTHKRLHMSARDVDHSESIIGLRLPINNMSSHELRRPIVLRLMSVLSVQANLVICRLWNTISQLSNAKRLHARRQRISHAGHTQTQTATNTHIQIHTAHLYRLIQYNIHKRAYNKTHIHTYTYIHTNTVIT